MDTRHLCHVGGRRGERVQEDSVGGGKTVDVGQTPRRDFPVSGPGVGGRRRRVWRGPGRLTDARPRTTSGATGPSASAARASRQRRRPRVGRPDGARVPRRGGSLDLSFPWSPILGR